MKQLEEDPLLETLEKVITQVCNGKIFLLTLLDIRKVLSSFLNNLA